MTHPRKLLRQGGKARGHLAGRLQAQAARGLGTVPLQVLQGLSRRCGIFIDHHRRHGLAIAAARGDHMTQGPHRREKIVHLLVRQTRSEAPDFDSRARHSVPKTNGCTQGNHNGMREQQGPRSSLFESGRAAGPLQAPECYGDPLYAASLRKSSWMPPGQTIRMLPLFRQKRILAIGKLCHANLTRKINKRASRHVARTSVDCF